MANRGWRYPLGAVAFTFLFVAMSGLAAAATLTVTKTSDSGVSGDGSLRGEIIAANSAGGSNTIQFAPGVTGTINLKVANGPLIVSGGTLNIQGPTGPGITIDGGDAVQLMQVSTSTKLSLENLTLAHGRVTGFASIGRGGAIVNNATLIVSNSTFSDNQVTGGEGLAGQGGAIFNNGTLTVTNSTFSANMATGGFNSTQGGEGGEGDGGAIFDNGTLTVTNSTFSANMATGGSGTIGGGGAGGAIANSNNGTLTVTNNTFSGNQAIGGGGGGGGAGGAIDNDGGTASLQGTIFAGSSPNNCNTQIAASFSLADDGSCFINGTNANMVVPSTSEVGLDPMGLAMHGGPTETIALLPGSLAIDQIPPGSCTYPSGSLNPCTTSSSTQLTCDQRGQPRPDPEDGSGGNCDIGAYELQETPAFVLNHDRVQIARSSSPNADEINAGLIFTENGSPECTAANDALDGFTFTLASVTCAELNAPHNALSLEIGPFVMHTVNGDRYGTFFFADSPLMISARLAELLPTPQAPVCGEFTLNLEVAGINSTPLGDGPFALLLTNLGSKTTCFDITNAIVGDQITLPPKRSVRHGIRR